MSFSFKLPSCTKALCISKILLPYSGYPFWLYPFKPFKINVSNIAHQKSNTECGIFSITFQTRWLLLLKRKGYNNVVFNDVISFKKMNDNVMKNLRFKFFRPNINSLLKN